ncbi:hypothetical protein D9M72_521840 [compost metagenome]
MKTPVRKFVVEFKSGRRLPKAQGNSIWGGTDLRALAREVEDQSTHLFGPPKTAVHEVTDPTPSVISVCEPLVEDLTPEEPSSLLSADSLGSSPTVIDEVADPELTPSGSPAAEPVPTSIEPPTVSKIAKATKKAPRKRVARALPAATSIAKNEPHGPPAGAVKASTALDDLATLDAENKRLRQLLANRLLAENGALKKMPERF